MYHLFVLNFIQQFSYLQQYLIIASFFFILLLFFYRWWCLLAFPISTFLVHWLIKRLSRSDQSPLKFFGYLYKYLLRKPSIPLTEQSRAILRETFTDEYKKYTKAIIGRYICIWYCPFISIDRDFLDELECLFLETFHQVSNRVQSLDIHEIIRLLINLAQKHVQQYLHAVDSYKKQHRQNRSSESEVEEFSRLIGFHPSLVKNDSHAYFKAIVELLVTEFLPEKVRVYSGSRPTRELLTQILVNSVFLRLFEEFSQPRMIYYLLTILLEDDEQKNNVEINEDSFISSTEISDQHNEQDSVELTDERSSQNNDLRKTPLEKIIYSATIITTDTAYNSMSGAAYTVYIIQCETKSPFVSDDIHRYAIQRRFREFMNLHRRLQENCLTSRECYGDIDDIYRAFPLGMDNMNPDLIRRRRIKLEQYIDKIISNEVLNCSHDVLEFFAFNTDPTIPFESSPASKLPVPRVDIAIFRKLTGVGNAITNLLPSKREGTPLRETFQLNVSVTREDASPIMKRLEDFNDAHSFTLKKQIESPTLNSIDRDFLQTLSTRPSLVSKRQETTESEIPFADALLNLLHTSLHSREAIINNESIHQIVRTLFGHLIEEFLKSELDDIFSPEKVLTYLTDLRTKVLWSIEDSQSKPMKHIKHRAYHAIINKIPVWLQFIVGKKNIRRIVINLLECFSHAQLNRHFLFNAFDSLIIQIIPDVATKDFLTKYVHMHANSRS